MTKEIVIFSLLPWQGKLLHREQMLALAFSRLGYRVTFVTRCKGFPSVTSDQGIEIKKVFALPYIKGYSKVIFKINDFILKNQLSYDLGKDGWFILSSPLWVKIVKKESDSQKLVYDMSDDYLAFATNKNWKANLKEYEDKLLKIADIVFVSSANLLAKVPAKKQVKIIPNGVDLEKFKTAKPVLNGIFAGKVVGFIGGIYQRINLGLIEKAVREYPETSFVMVGPTNRNKELREFEKYKNFHYLGAKPWPEIQDYFASFDVGIIPFIKEEEYPWLKSVDSVKVYQYAYFGCPIVVTHFGRIEELSKLVRIAKDEAEFLKALGEALKEEPGDPIKIKRKELAQDHDWQKLAKEMQDFIINHEPIEKS